LTAGDGSELAKIHKVKVLRNDRRQGVYVSAVILQCLLVSHQNVSVHSIVKVYIYARNLLFSV